MYIGPNTKKAVKEMRKEEKIAGEQFPTKRKKSPERLPRNNKRQSYPTTHLQRAQAVVYAAKELKMYNFTPDDTYKSQEVVDYETIRGIDNNNHDDEVYLLTIHTPAAAPRRYAAHAAGSSLDVRLDGAPRTRAPQAGR